MARGGVVRLSSKGQVIIPVGMRRRMGLKTGQALRVRAGANDEIVLRLDRPDRGDVDALRDRLRAAVKRSGRDPEAELYQRRRREHALAEKRRERGRP